MATSMVNQSSVWQTSLRLTAATRGFHLINHDIHQAMQSMPSFKTGWVNLFIQHTSASLCISENTCQDVREDLETYFNKAIPDNPSLYTHTLEGSDDMPAHIKNVILGSSLTIPLVQGQLGLGRWQGLFLCEHRNQAPARNIVITVQGIF